MKKVGGTFDATGAVINVGIGFVPDKLIIWNNTDAEDQRVIWSRDFRVAARVEGNHYQGDDAAAISVTPLAAAGGIKPYYGGDVIVTAAETHLVKDPAPNKQGSVTGWTLDTAANRTGKFNIDSLPTGVAAGSRILIDAGTPGSIAKWYTIEAITSDGGQDDEVTLSEAAPSGDILFISGAFDYISAAANITMPAGFTLAALADFNVDSDQLAFEAEKWDD
jgi:hypothetical protein